jgi:DNA helicase II / ATP-dependent DNA helicase PcrA
MVAINTTIINLSEEQKKLVNYNEGEGSLLVVAAAGSGKTRILTERVRYLLTEKTGKFSVLCLTFTKKAAEEMKERLITVPDITRRAYIGTIHEFAFQMISDRREMLGFPDVPHIIDRDQDRKKVLEQVFTENPLLSNNYKNEPAKIQQTKLSETLN